MTEQPNTAEVPIALLYGPRVHVSNVGRLSRAFVAICLVVLVIVSVALFISGARKNSQISDLRQHGVPVVVTVTSCYGLLGGSGSQAVGYSCRGSFTLDGHRANDELPGTALRSVGAKVKAVAVPSDPGLITLARTLPTQHVSNRVYLLPAVLLALAVVGGLLMVAENRHRRRTLPERSPTPPAT